MGHLDLIVQIVLVIIGLAIGGWLIALAIGGVSDLRRWRRRRRDHVDDPD